MKSCEFGNSGCVLLPCRSLCFSACKEPDLACHNHLCPSLKGNSTYQPTMESVMYLNGFIRSIGNLLICVFFFLEADVFKLGLQGGSWYLQVVGLNPAQISCCRQMDLVCF